MAKGKKGPALFEVIRAAQQKQLEQQQKLERARNQGPGVLHQAASLLGSPSAWLKGNRAPATQQPVQRDAAQATATIEAPAAPKPVVMREILPVVERVIPVVEAKPIVTREVPVLVTPTVRAPETESPAAAAARAVREEIAATSEAEAYVESTTEQTIESVSELFADPRPAAPKAPRASWKLPKLPSLPKLKMPAMPFQMTYTTGMVAGLAILAAAGIAFVATQSSSSKPDSVANSAPRPELLNVERDRPATPPSAQQQQAQAPRPGDNSGARANVETPNRVTVQSLPPVKPPTNVKRKPGMQYVVLLSVPSPEGANDLVKFLAANGVAATAEKALPGYSKSWYSVVTEKGFDKTRGVPEYDQFVSRCTKLMEQYAKGSKFKNFKPDTYTWRAPGQG